MFFHFGQASVKAEGFWYYRFLHPWDVALGLEGNEDLFSPCELAYDLAPGRTVWLVAGVERTAEAGDLLEARELERRTALRIPDMESDPERPHPGARGGRVRAPGRSRAGADHRRLPGGAHSAAP